jgi:hypothetical protein
MNLSHCFRRRTGDLASSGRHLRREKGRAGAMPLVGRKGDHMVYKLLRARIRPLPHAV